MTIAQISKLMGIVAGIITIISILGSAAWAYNKNYIDGKMGTIEQKLTDAVDRLDRIEKKIDGTYSRR